jgi:hypothetical protein
MNTPHPEPTRAANADGRTWIHPPAAISRMTDAQIDVWAARAWMVITGPSSDQGLAIDAPDRRQPSDQGDPE